MRAADGFHVAPCVGLDEETLARIDELMDPNPDDKR